MKRRHHPDQVAHIAAMLLHGKHDAEAHHIKSAVATAHAIIDEADPAEDPQQEPAEQGGSVVQDTDTGASDAAQAPSQTA